MKGFFQLLSSNDFRDLFEQFHVIGSEQIPLENGLGRILAEDINAPEFLPPFSRSTMDGYAVRAKDTFGCSDSEPALLKIAGEISMGQSGQEISLKTGQAATIWTGGELPAKGDGIVMVEYTHLLDSDTIEIFRPVAPGENVIKTGEDFSRNALVLKKGQRLRPQDLGVLAGLGITEATVVKQPVVAILSTGDELVEPEQDLSPGKIRDINSTTLAALIHECGCIPITMGIIKDDLETMQRACQKALDIPSDMLLLSGGSSVGKRDFTLKVLEEIENTKVLAHGISIKPGKTSVCTIDHIQNNSKGG